MDDGETTAPVAAGPSLRTDPVVPMDASRSARDRRAAVDALFTEHGEAIFGYCVRILRDPVLAEDVMQQVFLEAFRDHDRFRGQSSRRTWLFGIAVHRCLDTLRSRRRAAGRSEPLADRDEDPEMAELEAPGRGPFELLSQVQRLAALQECLAVLSPESRATVLLRFTTDMTYEQMTSHLSASQDALQMRIARAMPALRECLENKGWTGE